MMRISCKNIEADLMKFNDFIFRIKPIGCRTEDDMIILDYGVKRGQIHAE
jgi:hypothetical protein